MHVDEAIAIIKKHKLKYSYTLNEAKSGKVLKIVLPGDQAYILYPFDEKTDTLSFEDLIVQKLNQLSDEDW